MYQERVKSVIACKTDRNKLAASGVYSTSDERSQIKLKTIEKKQVILHFVFSKIRIFALSIHLL